MDGDDNGKFRPERVSNLPAWEVRDRGFEPNSGLQVSMKQKFLPALTRNDSILWGASVPDR